MDYPDRAALQYAQIRNVAYPDRAPADPYRTSFDRVTGRTLAETDGRRLTKVNVDHFTRDTEAEQRFLSLAHEVAHAENLSFGRGASNHGPDFWEDYAAVIETCAAPGNRRHIEAVYEDGLSWRRVRYRAVQSIRTANIDRRSGDHDDYQRRLAADLDYDGFEAFEARDTGVACGSESELMHDDEYMVLIDDLHGRNRWADDYTDDELRDILDRYEDADGSVGIPCPVVGVTEDARNSDDRPWTKAAPRDVRIHPDEDNESVRRRFALMDRLGIKAYATDARLFGDADLCPRATAIDSEGAEADVYVTETATIW